MEKSCTVSTGTARMVSVTAELLVCNNNNNNHIYRLQRFNRSGFFRIQTDQRIDLSLLWRVMRTRFALSVMTDRILSGDLSEMTVY